MRTIIFYILKVFLVCLILIEPSYLIVPYVIALGHISNQGNLRTHNITLNGAYPRRVNYGTKGYHKIRNRRRKERSGAKPYKTIGGNYFNCYGYVLGIIKWIEPGDFYYIKLGLGTPFNYNYFDNYDVDKLANYVIKDLESMGRRGRIINGPDGAINFNEYRIALRTGTHGYTWEGYLDADYHFMIQHSDGTWSDKYGQGLSRHLASGLNPSMISWDLPDWDSKGKQRVVYGSGVGYFDSQTVYLAVTN